MSDTFRTPERIVTGWGAVNDLGRLAAPLGRRALLVTGRASMKKSGIADRAIGLLRASGVAVELFDQVEREPDLATLDAGRTAARQAGADLVIGLGGGSAMDLAKAVAGLHNESAPSREFHAGRKIATTGLPLICIPTTSGTGSEATINSVISDHEKKIKTSIRDERFMPRVALVDPELTVPCPSDVTAAAGLDALSQAIESYVSRHATRLTESLSAAATVDLIASLETAVARPADQAARTRAALGSLMAGMALNNARLGVIHGIVHPLGVRYGIPHGLACGVFLPLAIEFNREAIGGKFEVLRQAFGGDPAQAVRTLLQRVGLPRDLKKYRVRADDFEIIADESLPSGSLKANPRTVTKNDIITMLQEVC